jgi:hypothetical protein
VTQGNLEGYGLTKPGAKATFSWKDPKKPARRSTRTLEFGLDIPGTDLTAARVAGSSDVLFVPATLAASVRKPADDFKSKDVFAGSALDVAGIDVARGRGRLTLSKKSGVWWIEQPIADLADRDAVDRIANEIASLRVTEFVPRAQAADLAALGLAPPVFRVTLTDAKGAKQAIDIGSTRSDGNTVYAAHAGQVFTVGNSFVDDLSREAVGFRDKRLVRFERSEVTGITVTMGARRRVFARQQAGWSIDGRSLLASAADDLMTAILDVESRSFIEDVPAAAFSGRPAEQVYEIRLAAGPAWTISISPFRGDYAAVVSRRPGVLAVGKDAVQSLQAAVEKATTAFAATPVPTAASRPAATVTPRRKT